MISSSSLTSFSAVVFGHSVNSYFFASSSELSTRPAVILPTRARTVHELLFLLNIYGFSPVTLSRFEFSFVSKVGTGIYCANTVFVASRGSIPVLFPMTVIYFCASPIDWLRDWFTLMQLLWYCIAGR